MRLLHVIPSTNPAGGGPIEAVTRLGLEYIRQGDTVEVVTVDDPDAPWVKTFPLRCHALGPAWFRLKYGYTRRLIPWLRRNSPTFDLVIVNGIWQFTGLSVWRAVRATSTPYVVFTHGMLDPWFKHRYPLKHLKKWMYWPWAEYRVLRDAKAVLFTSEEERRMARESFWLYRCNERVINYGTAPPPADAGDAARFRQMFPTVGAKRILLFLGRIHEKKGCDLLVRAYGAMLDGDPAAADEWHLVLAGPVASDGYHRSLERLVARHCPAGSVTWTGLLTGDQKWAAFRAADVFVLPSHHENFGVAIAESLACGVPVLISNKVNIWREIVQDGAGLVENDDYAGTVALLERWMRLDDRAREQMRISARHCFANRFDLRHTATRLTATLKALM